MHPDAGAIIGIALAGSVLVVAMIFLCVLHLPWPCCKSLVKSQAESGNRRVPRPSTSSHTAFANYELHGSSRNIDQLSATDLHHQNQAHFYSATGIVNPLWQVHNCHAPGILTASQQSLNYVHHHSSNPCQCRHHTRQGSSLSINIADTETSAFQYFTPQLHSPTDSPPPYPGHYNHVTESSLPSAPLNYEVCNNNPPPYSPKR